MNREAKRAQAREERKADQKAADAVPAGTLERTESERTSPAQFLREVRGELKKVAWPNRREVTNYTLVVLAVTVVLTAYIAGLDWVIKEALINVFE